MGCNTSKESVPAAEGQDKEKQENGDVNKGEDNNVANSETQDDKASSAKTITLRGSTPSSPTSHEKKGEEEEEAAKKIQAAFRGHKTRKSMKQPEKSAAGEPEPTKQELEAEFRPDDQELCHAATKIQASFRGHMLRKQMEKGEDGGADENPDSSKKPNNEEELDVDLGDPELNKAAVKIQASFRGHMVRKEAEGTTPDAH